MGEMADEEWGMADYLEAEEQLRDAFGKPDLCPMCNLLLDDGYCHECEKAMDQ